MSARLQRPRWADLVDSSDDEMVSPDATSTQRVDIDMGIRIEIDALVHTRVDRPRRCVSPLVRRRSVRMPMFTKQPPITPTVKPQISTASAHGQESKHSSGSIATPEDGRDRRFEKRRAAITIVKSMPEYNALREHRQRESSLGILPLTPDPTDQTISKRRWEAEVAIWRNATREKFQTS
jgi:hypothetical protein|eukprot:TRINITY_DN69275_c0_g1_i1.p1 TRINITY_DN69275_c0_g1~~TRINITY_DN69275_c0_g1_i1.p1  ORF type:complete len:180 (-),score=11.98 TRINITY_DN69275_c0_g1_i1:979-1518(-)